MQFRIALALFSSTLGLLAAPAEVRVWETNLVIPTYLAAPPSAVPRFYDGRTYQGAKATFYPYPIQDVLTDIKTNKSYQVLFLENDYVQISVIPELGGRIWSALDKVNGYDFFYRQHVVKPALIGMLGAWISGGVGVERAIPARRAGARGGAQGDAHLVGRALADVPTEPAAAVAGVAARRAEAAGGPPAVVARHAAVLVARTAAAVARCVAAPGAPR